MRKYNDASKSPGTIQVNMFIIEIPEEDAKEIFEEIMAENYFFKSHLSRNLIFKLL